MKGEDIKKNSDLIDKYTGNILVKLLVYLGKIKTASEYERYLKQIIKSLFSWFFVVFIMRALLIFICLLVAGATTSFYHPPLIEQFIAAEGISLTWFLLEDLLERLTRAIKRGVKEWMKI